MTSCTVSLLKHAGSDRPVQCLTITAVQRERDAVFSVITAELEPVRAPSLIAFFSQPLCLYVPVSMAVQQVFEATAHSGA